MGRAVQRKARSSFVPQESAYGPCHRRRNSTGAFTRPESSIRCTLTRAATACMYLKAASSRTKARSAPAPLSGSRKERSWSTAPARTATPRCCSSPTNLFASITWIERNDRVAKCEPRRRGDRLPMGWRWRFGSSFPQSDLTRYHEGGESTAKDGLSPTYEMSAWRSQRPAPPSRAGGANQNAFGVSDRSVLASAASHFGRDPGSRLRQ